MQNVEGAMFNGECSSNSLLTGSGELTTAPVQPNPQLGSNPNNSKEVLPLRKEILTENFKPLSKHLKPFTSDKLPFLKKPVNYSTFHFHSQPSPIHDKLYQKEASSMIFIRECDESRPPAAGLTQISAIAIQTSNSNSACVKRYQGHDQLYIPEPSDFSSCHSDRFMTSYDDGRSYLYRPRSQSTTRFQPIRKSPIKIARRRVVSGDTFNRPMIIYESKGDVSSKYDIACRLTSVKLRLPVTKVLDFKPQGHRFPSSVNWTMIANKTRSVLPCGEGRHFQRHARHKLSPALSLSFRDISHVQKKAYCHDHSPSSSEVTRASSIISLARQCTPSNRDAHSQASTSRRSYHSSLDSRLSHIKRVYREGKAHVKFAKVKKMYHRKPQWNPYFAVIRSSSEVQRSKESRNLKVDATKAVKFLRNLKKNPKVNTSRYSQFSVRHQRNRSLAETRSLFGDNRHNSMVHGAADKHSKSVDNQIRSRLPLLLDKKNHSYEKCKSTSASVARKWWDNVHSGRTNKRAGRFKSMPESLNEFYLPEQYTTFYSNHTKAKPLRRSRASIHFASDVCRRFSSQRMTESRKSLATSTSRHLKSAHVLREVEKQTLSNAMFSCNEFPGVIPGIHSVSQHPIMTGNDKACGAINERNRRSLVPCSYQANKPRSSAIRNTVLSGKNAIRLSNRETDDMLELEGQQIPFQTATLSPVEEITSATLRPSPFDLTTGGSTFTQTLPIPQVNITQTISTENQFQLQGATSGSIKGKVEDRGVTVEDSEGSQIVPTKSSDERTYTPVGRVSKHSLCGCITKGVLDKQDQICLKDHYSITEGFALNLDSVDSGCYHKFLDPKSGDVNSNFNRFPSNQTTSRHDTSSMEIAPPALDEATAQLPRFQVNSPIDIQVWVSQLPVQPSNAPVQLPLPIGGITPNGQNLNSPQNMGAQGHPVSSYPAYAPNSSGCPGVECIIQIIPGVSAFPASNGYLQPGFARPPCASGADGAQPGVQVNPYSLVYSTTPANPAGSVQPGQRSTDPPVMTPFNGAGGLCTEVHTWIRFCMPAAQQALLPGTGPDRPPELQKELDGLLQKSSEQLTDEERQRIHQLLATDTSIEMPPEWRQVSSQREFKRTDSMENLLQLLKSKPFESLTGEEVKMLNYLNSIPSNKEIEEEQDRVLHDLLARPYNSLNEEERELLSSLMDKSDNDDVLRAKARSILKQVLGKFGIEVDASDRALCDFLRSLSDMDVDGADKRARTPSMEAKLTSLLSRPFDSLSEEEKELLSEILLTTTPVNEEEVQKTRHKAMEVLLAMLKSKASATLEVEELRLMENLLLSSFGTEESKQHIILMEKVLDSLQSRQYNSLVLEEKNLLKFVNHLPISMPQDALQDRALTVFTEALLSKPDHLKTDDEKKLLDYIDPSKEAKLGIKLADEMLESLRSRPYESLSESERQLLDSLNDLPDGLTAEELASKQVDLIKAALSAKPPDTLTPEERKILKGLSSSASTTTEALKGLSMADEKGQHLDGAAGLNRPEALRLHRTPSMESRFAWLNAQPITKLTEEQLNELRFLQSLHPAVKDIGFETSGSAGRGIRSRSMEDALQYLLAKPFDQLTSQERDLLTALSTMQGDTNGLPGVCDSVGIWPWSLRILPRGNSPSQAMVIRDMMNVTASHFTGLDFTCQTTDDKYPPFIPYPNQAVYFNRLVDNLSPRIRFWPWSSGSGVTSENPIHGDTNLAQGSSLDGTVPNRPSDNVIGQGVPGQGIVPVLDFPRISSAITNTDTSTYDLNENAPMPTMGEIDRQNSKTLVNPIIIKRSSSFTDDKQ